MKIKLLAHLQGLSGKSGDIVFYNRLGKTFIRKAPGSYNKVPTEKQAAARERFIAAHRFAQTVIADPVLKALYEQRAGKGGKAYTRAVSEYMKRE